jgi:RNA polymerase sigma-70 factor (ECF subfamily)
VAENADTARSMERASRRTPGPARRPPPLPGDDNRTQAAAIGASNDDALIARTAQGDRAAWGALVDRHLGAVVRYAGYVLRDEAMGEDIAQDSFVRLAAKAESWIEGGPGVRSWLFRVARNLCIDHLRTRRTTPIEYADTLPDPRDAGVLDRELDLKQTVTAALDGLPERQRTAIHLVHFEGLSGEEAGAALEISVEALESLLARARRTLRRDLAGLPPDLLGEH